MKKKLAKTYKYIEGNNIITIEAGSVISGPNLERVLKAQPDWLVDADAEIEEPTDEGRLKDLRLTEAEKPAKPKDEDPKDPDKPKKKL